MKNLIVHSALFVTLGLTTIASYAATDAKLITEQDAIKAALAEVGVEVLGIRFDEPDTQWDVFVRQGDKAFEIEVDAKSGKIIAAEEETLAEIQAELSGDLSHEGVEGDVDK
ncbi:PepSY domain-containing protein [Photobacterium sp. BZF1]|uniref:PepSY domain-containing protein n=1 Tax=Photobacterium sp. BZF1 TaxID=1904457 RepID=UPI001653865F|nr:PepSY domain-containing protein [Photobacterium sp. BZF1]MBC7002339.1 PepSY domain-containing protein [Photobacterium sp. BZF1]